jgi:DNA-binding HxlR family transcriptional regulator
MPTPPVRPVRPEACLAGEPWVRQALVDAVGTGRDLGVRIRDRLRALPEPQFNEFLHLAARGVQNLFQAWTIEILSLLALRPGTRFNEMKRALPGISSRTLSAKLTHLEAEGLVARAVHEDRPVRVEYRLTPEGLTVARLMAPVIGFLNYREGVRVGIVDPIRELNDLQRL